MPKSNMMSEEQWRSLLEGTHPVVHKHRRVRGLLPADPRCRLCHTPFRGPGGFFLRRLSRVNEPWDKNPSLCRRCVLQISDYDVMGAEVAVSFLFADVRRSSELARRLGTREFTLLMQRFYEVATGVLFEHEALLDKIVGDEVVGFFLPFMTGDGHPRAAVETAEALFLAVGYGSDAGPWVPLGAGVHTGPAFVGYVSRGESSEFTALGDTINVAAHLATQAHAGEILVTEAVGASLETSGLERRHLSLKGHELDALVIAVDERGSAPSGVAAGP
ncbi:MAG TPA: adenylate/guanylate cyclase domain-containing protein [Actinomycetota bacterium]|jgi:adenylate cyclase|nr:adenylate/guanylate cyclase domain-containing protein [Actinomycetota bacterium]